MILEPKHKNLKGPLQFKETVQKIFDTKRYMSIARAFEWYYSQVILKWWHNPFKVSEWCLNLLSYPKLTLFYSYGIFPKFYRSSSRATTNVPTRVKLITFSKLYQIRHIIIRLLVKIRPRLSEFFLPLSGLLNSLGRWHFFQASSIYVA